MAFQLFVLCAVFAAASAGYLGGAVAPVAYSAAPAVSHVSYASPVVSYGAPALAAPAITSQHSNILRSYGNLGQVSTYSKTIDTPFSSVRKSDVRVSNPGVRFAAAAPVAYAAPAYAHAPVAYAAPAYAHAPVAHHASAIGVAYSAAPAVAHVSYSNGYGLNYGW